MKGVKVRDKVDLLIGDEVVTATVTVTLSTQFLCRTKRGRTEQFYFYADKGVTWRPHEQEETQGSS